MSSERQPVETTAAGGATYRYNVALSFIQPNDIVWI